MSDILYPRELGKAGVVTLEDAIAYLEEKWHSGGGGSGGDSEGEGSGITIIDTHMDENQHLVLEKTWQEIYDAEVCVIRVAAFENTMGFFRVIGIMYSAEDGEYVVEDQHQAYSCSAATDYPVEVASQQ